MPTFFYVPIDPWVRMRRLLLLFFIVAAPSTSFGFDCGNPSPCSLRELTSYLDRIKYTFETADHVYDQIYGEGEATIVFVQRIMRTMNKSERNYVRIKASNKEFAKSKICNDAELNWVFDQGLSLKYVINDIDRNPINSFTISPKDC